MQSETPLKKLRGLLGTFRGFLLISLFSVALLTGFVECREHCSALNWLLKSAVSWLTLLLLGVAIWLQTGGWSALLAFRQLRRLRRAADTVALALGATAEQKLEDSAWFLVYGFPDGHSVSVRVTRWGVTTWTPAWSPGSEKDTEGLQTLIKVIECKQAR